MGLNLLNIATIWYLYTTAEACAALTNDVVALFVLGFFVPFATDDERTIVKAYIEVFLGKVWHVRFNNQCIIHCVDIGCDSLAECRGKGIVKQLPLQCAQFLKWIVFCKTIHRVPPYVLLLYSYHSAVNRTIQVLASV